MNRTLMILMGLLVMGGSGVSLAGVPKPAQAPVSWELKFTFYDPERITLTLPGDQTPTTYWFIRYTVENNAGQDIEFFPAAELVTSSLQVIAAGDQISPTVYDAIRERYHTTAPFMLEPNKMSGPLLQGEDNAKTGFVAFRDFNPNDNDFTIYFSGLSGEIQRVTNPSFDKTKPESPENPRVFTLRKALEIKYSLPGDPQTRNLVNPVRKGQDWVMR